MFHTFTPIDGETTVHVHPCEQMRLISIQCSEPATLDSLVHQWCTNPKQ